MRLSNAVLSVFVGVSWFLACGESKKSVPPSAADGGQGSAQGGQGGETPVAPEAPPPVRCGFATCKPITVLGTTVAPCCVNPLEGICGAELDTRAVGLPLTMACQPLTQAGALDAECPANPGAVVAGLPIPPLLGCCRAATSTCGYLVTDFGGLLPFAPGCIDATPFLNGEEPVTCGSEVEAGGGASAGSPGGAGGAGAGSPGTVEQGGAPGAGGAPGGRSGLAGEAGAGGEGSAG